MTTFNENMCNRYIENWNIWFFYKIISSFGFLKECKEHSLTRHFNLRLLLLPLEQPSGLDFLYDQD